MCVNISPGAFLAKAEGFLGVKRLIINSLKHQVRTPAPNQGKGGTALKALVLGHRKELRGRQGPAFLDLRYLWDTLYHGLPALGIFPLLRRTHFGNG